MGERLRFYLWQEDYEGLRDDRDALSGLDALKFIPLNDDGQTYLTLGGQYRFRLESLNEQFYGLTAQDSFTSLNHRLLLHADIHLGERVRVFGEVGFSGRMAATISSDHSTRAIPTFSSFSPMWT